MPSPLNHRPVLVGQGEITLKTADLSQAREPLALMEAAVRRAFEDAGAPGALALVDSIDVVSEYSWPYPDAPGQLAQRLGIAPARQAYGEVGGESPVRFIHEAALRIQRGESRVAVVVGAESEYFVQAARKAGQALPWSPRNPQAHLKRGTDWLRPLAVQLGVASPASVYPFYENATLAAWGQTPAEALEDSGRIWSGFSQAAQANASAWSRQALAPEDITAITPANRLIAWPYTVRVIANPQVNQGAAVVLMDAALAQQLQVPERQWLHLWGGAAASEPEDYLDRADYRSVPAQTAVLGAARQWLADPLQDCCIELYSCFPVVPKLARRALGLPAHAPLSCTGGLSFFGAPLSNYMTHATAAVMRRLRQPGAPMGLLYGQGGYATSHHALVVSSRPAPRPLDEHYSVQAAADAARGPAPALDLRYSGPAQLETHTTLFERDGSPRHGVVIARTPQSTRVLACVPASDTQAIGLLTSPQASPVGLQGTVALQHDGTPRWHFA